MNDKRKANQERVVMDYFREKYADFPSGKLVQQESPDFLLKLNRRHSIGIELTRLEDRDQSIQTVKELELSIIAAVTKKVAKLPIYRDLNLNEIWLIIFSEVLTLPASVNLEKLFARLTINSEFRKIFLFDLFKGKVYLANQ